MTPVAAKARASSIGPVIAVALGSTWAFVSALAFAHANSFELVNVADWVPVVSFSIALALLAPTAWLIAELAGRGRPVVVAAILMAIGGLVAAVANFIEDGLGVESFGKVFAFGLFGLLAGLVGLAVTLALTGRFVLAALSVATFAGLMMSTEAGGGLLILAAWLVAAVGLRRG